MRTIECPYCSAEFPENCEYVDVGVGGPGVQVTPNVCEDCGASELGAYKPMNERGAPARMAQGRRRSHDQTEDGRGTAGDRLEASKPAASIFATSSATLKRMPWKDATVWPNCLRSVAYCSA